MGRRRKIGYLLSFLFLLCAASLVSWLGSKRHWLKSWRARHEPVVASFKIEPPVELQSFLKQVAEVPIADAVVNGSAESFLYSAAGAGRFTIFDQKNRPLAGLSTKQDHFSPVRTAYGVDALVDDLGDQDFHFEGALHGDLATLHHLSRAFNLTSPEALLVIAKPQWDKEVAYYVTRTDGNYRIADSLPLDGIYNGHDITVDGKLLVIASRGGMWAWEPGSQKQERLVEILPGEKAGPALDDQHHRLYFSVVDASGFREIFTVNYRRDGGSFHFDTEPKPFLQNGRDKSHLAIAHGSLYFVEDEATRYLLKRCRLPSAKEESLTSDGVVYTFAPSEKSDDVYAIHADADHPARPIRVGAPPEPSPFSLGKPKELRPEGLSPAWFFEPAKKARGVVLTIHGGPDINVSPRWDATFELWRRMDLAVVAPNYPGSRGFGARYLHAQYDESISDLSGWLAWVRVNYPGVPVIVEGLSYGGKLAQELWVRDAGRIDGLILRSTGLVREFHGRSLPPTLVQFGKHDAIVDAKEVWDVLYDWKLASSGRVFFQAFNDEGHLIRAGVDRAASLAGIAAFLSPILTRP